MLKFGQTIDLESLDEIGSSKMVDDLNKKIGQRLGFKHKAELARIRRAVAKDREHLLVSTQDNTAHLERVAQLTHQQQVLEKELNAGGAQVSAGDQTSAMKREIDERNRLVQLVKLQAKEIDAL